MDGCNILIRTSCSRPCDLIHIEVKTVARLRKVGLRIASPAIASRAALLAWKRPGPRGLDKKPDDASTSRCCAMSSREQGWALGF